MRLPEPVTLSSGLVAEVEEDRWVPGAIQLLVDGTPQSHVNLRDPSEVFFEYIRRIAHAIDLFREPGAPISVLHLGGGAFTLPRYVEATRPGSRQQIVELESALVELVRAAAPLPKRASIRVRHGDAREVLAKLPQGMIGAIDLVVVDIFAGARTPAHVSSVEFYELIAPLLAPDGLVVVNTTDGTGQAFTRSQVATLASVFETVAAVGEPQTLKGRRFGNVVLLAAGPRSDDERSGARATTGTPAANRVRGDSDAASYTAGGGESRGYTDTRRKRPTAMNSPEHIGELDWLPRLLASGPHPARMLVGRELSEWLGKAKAVTDVNAVPSPEPPPEVFSNG